MNQIEHFILRTAYIFIVPLFFLSTSVIAQTEDDTLLNLKSKVKESKSDSALIQNKIALVEYVLNRDIDTTRILINEVLTKLEGIEQKNSYYNSKKAEAINYLAIIEAKQSFSESALSNYLKALAIAEKIDDSIVLGLTIHNLGMFYQRQKEFDKAKAFLKKAIIIKEAIDLDSDDIALSYNMLGVSHFYKKEYDSAYTSYNRAKQLYKTKLGKTKVNGNLALLYYTSKQFDKAINTFQENIEIFKDLGILNELSIAYQNLAASYNGLKEYDKAITILDSAIRISKEIKHKERLSQQFASRSAAYSNKGNYEKALEDYKLYKAYHDSLNSIEKAKRITELELNYQFEKKTLKKELALQNEKVKKQWYLALLILFIASAITIFILIRKNVKHRLNLSARELENEQLQRKTTEQILQIKDAELKNESLNSQIKQEFQESFINQLKSILSIPSDEERVKAIKSLLVSLKSKNSDFDTSLSLSEYLDKVSPEFKVKLNTHFPFFKEKEKKLLYLMKLGLSTNEMKDLQNVSLATVKSTRYRIRKKLGIESDIDIIGYIEHYKEVE